MSITHAIMLIGIIIAALVALSIGHLQRKQMRQIELYKLDPSVGLVPLPSAITRFVKSKWDKVLGFGAPASGLLIEFVSAAPLTRASVFLISFSVAFLLANVVMLVVFRLAERTASLIAALGAAQERHLEITARVTAAVESLTEQVLERADGT